MRYRIYALTFNCSNCFVGRDDAVEDHNDDSDGDYVTMIGMMLRQRFKVMMTV